MMPEKYFHLDRDGDVLILILERSVSSLADDVLIEQMRQTLALDGVQGVVVDFSRVEYFGSVLLEALREVWNAVGKSHLSPRKMALCGITPITREILHVSRFDTLWPIFATRREAIDAVKSA